MAQVSVRVRINQVFSFEISARDKEEAIDEIVNLKKAHDKFLEACIDEFTIEEAEYDEYERDEIEDES